MRLTITSIAARGEHEKERIVMKANADGDVGSFAIFRSQLNDGGTVSTSVSDVFWFPDKKIKAGDLVVLYSKSGSTSERPAASGSGTVHFYYWGKSAALWKEGNKRSPVLVLTSDWEVFKG